jgi:hypothetical protein
MVGRAASAAQDIQIRDHVVRAANPSKAAKKIMFVTARDRRGTLKATTAHATARAIEK